MIFKISFSCRRLSLLLLFLSMAVITKAQQALIVMKDSARVATEVRVVEGDLLLVKEGALSLNLIASIKFSGLSREQLNQTLIDDLLKKDIAVFIDNIQLRPKRPAESKPERLERSDSTIVLQQDTKTQVVESGEQQTEQPVKESEEDFENFNESSAFYLGIGIGLDYGGLGARFTFVPNADQTVSLGIFAAGGYAVNGLGFNAGLTGRFGNKRLIPTLSAMYGYNGVIKILGAPQYDKTYFGPSIGLGFESKRNSDNSHIHLELILPIRSSAYYDDLKALQSNPAIDINDPFPILFSIGYHFKI